MKKAMSYAKEFFHRADIFLLVMGLICAIFGIVVISSATASYHSAKYVIVQSASLILGVFAFVVMTVLDVDVLADKWQILCAFNVVFLLLLIPFGVNTGGNKSWIKLPLERQHRQHRLAALFRHRHPADGGRQAHVHHHSGKADQLLERIPRPQLRVVGRAAGGPFRAAVRADPRRVV